VAKVGKAHEDHRWTHWAVTRDEFSALVREIGDLLPSEDPPRVSINLPRFERAFESVEEFEENVTAEAWPTVENARATVWARSRPVSFDELRATLDAAQGAIVYWATLSVEGATSRDRNAIRPELLEVVGRHARDKRRAPSALRLVAWATLFAYVVVLIFSFLVSVALGPVYPGNWVKIGLEFGGSLCLVAAAAHRTQIWGRAHGRAVEFLPPDRIGRWDREKTRLLKRVRWAGAVLVGLATVAGAVFAGIAVF
jgi:hypothetical protein